MRFPPPFLEKCWMVEVILPGITTSTDLGNSSWYISDDSYGPKWGRVSWRSKWIKIESVLTGRRARFSVRAGKGKQVKIPVWTQGVVLSFRGQDRRKWFNYWRNNTGIRSGRSFLFFVTMISVAFTGCVTRLTGCSDTDGSFLSIGVELLWEGRLSSWKNLSFLLDRSGVLITVLETFLSVWWGVSQAVSSSWFAVPSTASGLQDE